MINHEKLLWKYEKKNNKFVFSTHDPFIYYNKFKYDWSIVDVYVHADLHGAASIVIKNPTGKKE